MMKRLGITLLACTFLAILSTHAQESKKATKQETVKETTRAEAPSPTEKQLNVPVGSKSAPTPKKAPEPETSGNTSPAKTPATPQTIKEVESESKSDDKPVSKSTLVKKKKAKKQPKKTPAGETKK
jgi:hypothetical protein